MKAITISVLSFLIAPPLHAQDATNKQLSKKIQLLQQQARELQNELNQLQHQLLQQPTQKDESAPGRTAKKHLIKPVKKHLTKPVTKHKKLREKSTSTFHSSNVYVHTLNGHPESVEFNPTALLAEGKVVTFIGGTPVITAPYLGSRPAFSGSDYIVNISSINRDIRLMEQRRQLYRAYQGMGYPTPNTPIIALSGKVEPIGSIGDSYTRDVTADWNLGSAELDASSALNSTVQGYISLAYDPAPPSFSGQRIANSTFGLGMGFVNIGNLDKSPYYFTAGQLFVPFGRFSSAMISAPLTMIMGRTKARPFILGYKSQGASGPFAAIYGFKGDTTLDNSGVGGVNIGYIYNTRYTAGEIGASFISSIDNAGGLQANGARQGNFAGFASFVHGSEAVKTIPAAGVHGTLRFASYNLTAEWVGSRTFRAQDLSFNGHGAQLQALQLEAGKTFMLFNRPSSFALGFQWSKEALALRLPERRFSALYNISIWKDTVESLEYRRDLDYGLNQFANGSAPPGVVNTNTIGTNQAANTVLAQIGVYF